MTKEEALKERNAEREAEVWGCDPLNAKSCETCRFVRVVNGVKAPKSSYCEIYEDEGDEKPWEITHGGAACEFREAEK